MANTDCSVLISALLDSMGFNQRMIDFRINNTRYLDVIGALGNTEVGSIMTGGKAEGTSHWEEGDIDFMQVHKFITVSERHVDPPSPRRTVLYTEDRGVHPGYTWLRVGHYGVMDDVIQQCVVRAISAKYSCLSSHIYNQCKQQLLKRISPSNIQLLDISGPSQPALFKGSEGDVVEAFPHPDWPVQASPWIDRCRTNGWPPETIVTAIVQSGCHIVPKGFKGSPSEDMEWCISFAAHEKSIVQLFNLTQKHVYILLKNIAKDLKECYPYLKDLVTSYTMKTVALWQVERHHAKDWDRPHLLDRLMEALDFLKSCVDSRNLPAYFITKNNLFDGKINEVTAAGLSYKLNNLLSRGAECVFMFLSIQQQLQKMKIPGRRLGVYSSGMEMGKLILFSCRDYLFIDHSQSNILRVLSLINSPDMTIHRSLTKDMLNQMRATLAYIQIARVKKVGFSLRKNYESYQFWLLLASTTIDTDRMAGRVKFAGVLHVLGKTKQAMEILHSIKPQPHLSERLKCNYRKIIGKEFAVNNTDSDYIEAAYTKLGRDRFVQRFISLAVRYTREEMDIVPDVLKYELFHVPETVFSSDGTCVDPDMLRYYLLYKCYTELGYRTNAEAAFMNLIRIATNEQFDPYMEYREVSLNVLGLLYLEKEDYLSGYSCFCQAMSLRSRLLVEKWSTATPWHLAVLASKLINRPQAGCSNHQLLSHTEALTLSL